MSNKDTKKKSKTAMILMIIVCSLSSTAIVLLRPTDDINFILEETFIPGDNEWTFPIPEHSRIVVILSQEMNWTGTDYCWDIVNKFTITVGQETQVVTIRLSELNIFERFIQHSFDSVTFNDTGSATMLYIYYGMEDWFSIPEEHHLPDLELRLSIVLEETYQ